MSNKKFIRGAAALLAIGATVGLTACGGGSSAVYIDPVTLEDDLSDKVTERIGRLYPGNPDQLYVNAEETKCEEYPHGSDDPKEKVYTCDVMFHAAIDGSSHNQQYTITAFPDGTWHTDTDE
jgi:hypothetical protein